MAAITCALNEILSPDVCRDRGGIRAAYWFDTADVDWEAMAADATKWDGPNQLIEGFTMIGGATMHKLTFERKQAFYDFTYTSDNDFYQLLVTMQFRGKDAARRNTLASAIQCCNIGMIIYGNAGEQRVLGVDWSGDTFDPMLEALRITRHLDSGGQLGTSKGRDELDLGGQAFFAPLYANVPEASLPLA